MREGKRKTSSLFIHLFLTVARDSMRTETSCFEENLQKSLEMLEEIKSKMEILEKIEIIKENPPPTARYVAKQVKLKNFRFLKPP